MKPQHRSLAAIVLSIVVIIIWYAFFSPKKAPTPPAQASAESAQQTVEAQKDVNAAAQQEPTAAVEEAIVAKEEKEESATDPQSDVPEKIVTIDNKLLTANFTNKGGVPKNWSLKGYSQEAAAGSPPIDMAYDKGGIPPTMDLAFDAANFSFPEKPTYRIVSTDSNTVVFEWKSDEARITKTIKLSADGYTSDIEVAVDNLTKKALTATPVLTVSGLSLPSKKSGFFSFLKQPPATNKSPVYFMGGKVHREKNVGKIPAAQVIAPDPSKGSALYWSGLEDRYFLSAVVPRTLSSGVSAVMGASALPSEGAGVRGVYAGAQLAPLNIAPNGTAQIKFTTYMGPKEINYLKAVGVNLDEAIDYGWFTIIAIPILYLLKMFYSVVRNYGVAIILLTVFIKLLLHPINIKSMKSMKAMQQLQPKLKELQKKYKDNKEKLNMETMQLFRANKVNPMGGCLPMILQFPIYIALYKVLWNSIELYHAPFFWFYKDLSAPDPYLITPILLGVGMLLQQRLMPSATADPAQQKMMMIMPIMFTVFMVFLPVGLVVYILVNTVMSVATQWMYNKGIRMRDVLRFKFKPAS